MPPAAVKTYQDLVCYAWAKTIAWSAGMKENHGFIMDRFKKLRGGEFQMSEIVREDLAQAVEGFRQCIYCGSQWEIPRDHLIPKAVGGPDTFSNLAPACGPCNSSKGARDAIDRHRERSTQVPRIVWGKYLKLMKERWEAEGRIQEAVGPAEKDRWKGLSVE